MPTDGNTVLQSFTVAMGGSIGGQMSMTAAVFAWDQTDFRPSGPALAATSISTPLITASAPYRNDFYSVTLSPDVQLSPGQ